MRRALVVAGLVGLSAAAVAVIERLNEDRQYRQLLIEGERALGTRQAYAAIEAFSGALALRPSSMVAYYRRGEAYGTQGQWDNAVRDLRMAHALAPDAAQPLESLGRLFDRNGEPAEAARWYEQAAVLLKDAEPSLLYALAVAQYRAGQPAAAHETLRRAIGADGALTRAHYLLGLVYRDLGEPEKAVASLRQALKLAPGMVPAREELADLLCQLGRSIEAVPLLAALAADDPRVPRFVALADAELLAGHVGAALDVIARAEALAPGDSRLSLARGRAYLARAEQDPRAETVSRVLSSLDPTGLTVQDHSERLALFARAIFLSGDVRRAERLLQEATAHRPVYPEGYAYLADAAERLGHPALALEALERLEALTGGAATPGVRGARSQRMGRLALLSGAFPKALRLLEQAVADGHTDAATWGLLARVRWEMADAPGARRALGLALAQAPDHPDLLRLTHLIE